MFHGIFSLWFFFFFPLAFSWHFLFGYFWQYSLLIISFLTTLFVLVLVVILNKFICHSKPNAYFCIAIEEWWQERLKSSNRPCLAVHQCWKHHHSCLGAFWTLALQRLSQGSHPSRRNLLRLQGVEYCNQQPSFIQRGKFLILW